MDSAPNKLHPLLTVAAISVTAASLAAIGVLTGILPSPNAAKPDKAVEPVPVVAQLAAAPAPALAVPSAPAVPAAAVEIEQKPAPVVPAVVPVKPPKPVIKPYKPVTSKPAVHTVTASHMPPPPPVTTAHQVPANMPPVPPDYRPATASVPPPPPPICRECGTVEMVREVVVPQPTETPGIGAVAGGILGGVLGHQMGSGRGNDAATVLGAIGGAFAGHQIEKTQRKTARYEITVRMDDGSQQLLNAEQAPAWRGGERVKVINGTAMPMI